MTLGHDQVLGEFWRWACSDLIDNRTRSIFGEFLVGYALGCLEGRRLEWSCYDLLYNDVRIEVKTSGYVQTWHREGFSNIKFGIAAAKNGWDARVNDWVGPGPHADVYVFCVHTQKERDKAAQFDVSDWDFYVVATSELMAAFPGWRTIGLTNLRRITSAVSISELKQAVDLAAAKRVG